MSTPKICPMLAAGNPVHMTKCREDGCAWWDDLAGSCGVIASVTLEREEAARSATNTTDGKGGTQSLPDAESTSTIHENGGFVKCQ